MTGYLHDVNRDSGIWVGDLPAVKHALSLGRHPLVGFSGTRKGMTPRQMRFLAAIIETLKPCRFDHGACKGADAEAHRGITQTICEEVHLWWGNLLQWQMDPGYEAKGQVPRGNVAVLVHHVPQPPLDRTVDLVREKDVLIACPSGPTMELRSGTWSAVRYADQLNVKTLVISPWETDEQ